MSARVLLTIEYIAAARSPPGIAAGEQPIASAAELLMHYNRLETSNYRFSGEGARVSWRCRGLSDPGLSVSVAPFSPRGGAVSALKGLTHGETDDDEDEEDEPAPAGVPVVWVYVGGAALGVSLLLNLILLLR